MSDYIAGRIVFRGQRELTMQEAEEALANLEMALGRKSPMKPKEHGYA